MAWWRKNASAKTANDSNTTKIYGRLDLQSFLSLELSVRVCAVALEEFSSSSMCSAACYADCSCLVVSSLDLSLADLFLEGIVSKNL